MNLNYIMKTISALVLAASFFVVLSSGCSSGSKEPPVTAAKAPVDFDQEVLPIFERSCFPCHGPTMSPASMAGFRVDLREHAVGYDKIVPGDPDNSPLFKRLVTKDNSKRMPPLKSKNPQLNAEEIDLLKRWIKEGASFGAT